jgi:hypothetical protein
MWGIGPGCRICNTAPLVPYIQFHLHVTNIGLTDEALETKSWLYIHYIQQRGNISTVSGSKNWSVQSLSKDTRVLAEYNYLTT